MDYRNLLFGGSQYQTSSYSKSRTLSKSIKNLVGKKGGIPSRGYTSKIIEVYDGRGSRVYRGQIGKLTNRLASQTVDNRSRNGYDDDRKLVIMSRTKPYEKRKYTKRVR